MNEHEPIDDPKVTAAHRALRDTPSPALDARILAAATAAAAEDTAARASQARWRRWVPAVGVAATMVLGLALSLQMLVTPEPATFEEGALLKESASPAELRKAPSNYQVAPVAEPAPVAQERAVTLELPKVDVPAQDPAPQAAMAGGSPYIATPAAAPIAPTTAERAAEVEVMRQEIAADAKQNLERVEVTGARAKRTQQADDSVAPAAAAKFGEAPEPADAWRKRITDLRTAGKTEDAEREQRAFCAAYPDETECRQ